MTSSSDGKGRPLGRAELPGRERFKALPLPLPERLLTCQCRQLLATDTLPAGDARGIALRGKQRCACGGRARLGPPVQRPPVCVIARPTPYACPPVGTAPTPHLTNSNTEAQSPPAWHVQGSRRRLHMARGEWQHIAVASWAGGAPALLRSKGARSRQLGIESLGGALAVCHATHSATMPLGEPSMKTMVAKTPTRHHCRPAHSLASAHPPPPSRQCRSPGR